MPVDDELDRETNPDLDQHFLSNSAKLALLVEAAGVRPTDHVVEVGAGIGTVAELVPACRSLTLVEYDAGLTPHLRRRVPHARVIEGDALAVLPGLRCDLLLSNLPSRLTPAVVSLLSTLDFRVALATVPSIEALASLQRSFVLQPVTELEPDDFRPRQEAAAEIVKIWRVHNL